MKLQISYDFTDLEQALKVAKQTAQYADILEVGFPLLLKNGVAAVYEFKKQFPDKKILADAKLADRVDQTVPLLCKQAADYITILAGTSNATIRKASSLAHSFDSLIMLDLLDSHSMGQSAHEAQTLGIDIILFHKAHDETTILAIVDQWADVKENTSLPIFISGQIDKENITEILELHPQGIIIGSAITQADNPGEQAAYFKSLLS